MAGGFDGAAAGDDARALHQHAGAVVVVLADGADLRAGAAREPDVDGIATTIATSART
jgi:hypothetical protein